MARNNEARLFDINDGWRLSADRLQWILSRLQGSNWRPLYYVSSEKRVLMRLIAEEGIVPSPSGQAALNALPARFQDYLEERSLAA